MYLIIALAVIALPTLVDTLMSMRPLKCYAWQVRDMRPLRRMNGRYVSDFDVKTGQMYVGGALETVGWYK